MNQSDLVLSLLRGAWPEGIHSHDFRVTHHVGDPAKRICELKERGHEVRTELERRNDRHGVRYFLVRHEFDAIPSTGNFPSSPGGENEAAGRTAPNERPRRLSPAATPIPSPVAAGRSLPVDRDLLFSMCAHVSRTERKLKTEGKAFKPRTLEDCIALVDRVGEQTEMGQVAA